MYCSVFVGSYISFLKVDADGRQQKLRLQQDELVRRLREAQSFESLSQGFNYAVSGIYCFFFNIIL